MIPSGYDAMGHPVPAERLSAGYRAVKEMMPDANTEEAMTLVGRVASQIERDDPYGALLDHSQGFKTDLRLDLTGRYRLLATLCSAPVAA